MWRPHYVGFLPVFLPPSLLFRCWKMTCPFTGRVVSLTKFAVASSEYGRISSQPVLSAFHPILFFSWRRAWTLLQVWGVEGAVHCFWLAKEGSRALACQASVRLSCNACKNSREHFIGAVHALFNGPGSPHCQSVSLCVCVCLHVHMCV